MKNQKKIVNNRLFHVIKAITGKNESGLDGVIQSIGYMIEANEKFYIVGKVT